MSKRIKHGKFTKAFTRISGGSGFGFSYRDARARAGEALALVPHNLIPGETIEPRFYLSYLEGAICDFIEGGYLKALGLALKEYRDFLKGVSC